MNRFEFAGKFKTNVDKYKVWQYGNHAKECYSADFILEKMQYIHENPVKAAIVDVPEHYLHSSARNYVGLKGLIDIENIFGDTAD